MIDVYFHAKYLKNSLMELVVKEIDINNNSRIDVFDTLKGIGIIFVILGHYSFDSSLIKFIYSFHMPLFFLISGCLYSTKIELSFTKTVKKLFFKIIIPYVLFVLISLLVCHEHGDLIKRLFYIRAMGPNEALWFLPLYVIVVSTFVAILQFLKKYILIDYAIYLLCVVSIMITPKFQQIFPDACILMLGVLPVAVAFMCIGYEFYKNKTFLYRNDSFVSFILFGIGIIILAYAPIANIANINSYLYFPCALCFCYPLYHVANNIKSKFLIFVGKNSILYLGLHSLIADICNKQQYIYWFSEHFDGLMLWILKIIIITALTTVIIYCCNYFIIKINRIVSKLLNKNLLKNGL